MLQQSSLDNQVKQRHTYRRGGHGGHPSLSENCIVARCAKIYRSGPFGYSRWGGIRDSLQNTIRLLIKKMGVLEHIPQELEQRG